MGAGAAIGGVLGGPMGAIGGHFIQRALRRRSQESQPTPPVSGQTDLLDPSALAARQRAARRMSDGIRDTYSTSSRGTEGQSGAGLRGPPQSGDDIPIIPDSGPIPAGLQSLDQAQAAHAAQQAAAAVAEARRRTNDGRAAGRQGSTTGRYDR